MFTRRFSHSEDVSLSKSRARLSISLLMMTPEAFVDIVDQDQTAQNVQSDL